MGANLTLSLPILFLAATLNASLVPQIRFLGGGPDLVLLLVLSWSVQAELDEGITWAFVGGILQDLLSAAPTGLSTLGMLPMVFGMYFLRRQLYRVGFVWILVFAFAGTFVKEVILSIGMAFAGFSANVIDLFSYVILPSAIYNAVAVVVVYGVVRWIRARFRRDPRVFR
jgi:rod shape-determining protein MreD